MSLSETSFYYVEIRGKGGGPWIADERIKKHFLDGILRIRKKAMFSVYAFCLLDEKAVLLIETPIHSQVKWIIENISFELERSYRKEVPNGKEKSIYLSRKLKNNGAKNILEYCCYIHLLANGYAKRTQDYWWSSYQDYFRKGKTGLIETYKVLNLLDAEPYRALRKFIRYHENFSTT